MSREALDRTLAAADEVIELVRGKEDLGGGSGDTTTLFTLAAVRHGFRRLVAIRQLADAGAGDEASVVMRSLLSILARAGWATQPDSRDERGARFDRLLRRQYMDELNELDLLRRAGVPVDDNEALEALGRLAELDARGVPGLPSERQMFEALNMAVAHAIAYVPASNRLHFALRTARGDRRPHWRRRSPARSAEVRHRRRRASDCAGRVRGRALALRA